MRQIKFVQTAVFTPTRKIQIIIFHLLALLAARFLPEHAPVLLFNVSITTGEGNCSLLQLYLVNVLEFLNSNFFFLMVATQCPAQFFWELEMQGNRLVWTSVHVPKYRLHYSTYVASQT